VMGLAADAARRARTAGPRDRPGAPVGRPRRARATRPARRGGRLRADHTRPTVTLPVVLSTVTSKIAAL
jgi:hypothetical protein